MSRLLRQGTRGILLTYSPQAVMTSLPSMHFNVRSSCRQLLMVSTGGWSMNSSSRMQGTPMALSCRMGPLSSLLSISGTTCCSRSSQSFLLYSLKHLPSASRPALPVLCIALALDMGTTLSISTFLTVSQTLIFMKPGSTTYRSPLTVILVSAILVARMTRRLPSWPGVKMLCWYSWGSAEYNIRMSRLWMLWSWMDLPSFLDKVRIQSSPVRNVRMSPQGSVQWICKTVLKAAYKQFSTGSSTLQMWVGQVRPCTRTTASLWKKCRNLSASIVADMMTILNLSLPARCRARNKAISTSVLMLLSCASSSTKTSYIRPVISSLMAMPSVMNITLLLADLFSSKRTLQPISWPRVQPISYATRSARVIALMRRGCVMRMRRYSGYRYWGSWVVLPQPVSPQMTVVGCCRTRARISGRWAWMGRGVEAEGCIVEDYGVSRNNSSNSSRSRSTSIYREAMMISLDDFLNNQHLHSHGHCHHQHLAHQPQPVPVLVLHHRLPPLVMRIDDLPITQPHPLDIHQELTDPPRHACQLFLPHKLPSICFIHYLQLHIGYRLTFLNEAEGIDAGLGVGHLESGTEVDAGTSLMPDLFDVLMVQDQVDTIVVVVVVEVEQFGAVGRRDRIVQASLGRGQFQLQALDGQQQKGEQREQAGSAGHSDGPVMGILQGQSENHILRIVSKAVYQCNINQITNPVQHGTPQ